MKNKQKVINTLKDVEERLCILQERSYNPELTTSEIKEINKRKKKLDKNKQKLLKKLEQCQTRTNRSDR
tara:strand:- start:194 stop:400 length:207 start_codon:yes stop_codon:yes gene_type:complete